MELSMWIINSELSEKYETIPLIVDGQRNIESVRLFSDDGNLHQGPSSYIYAGSSADFFMGDYCRSTIHVGQRRKKKVEG